jgi:pyruvate-ferredoxin/flavodoxin oxidoreductase
VQSAYWPLYRFNPRLSAEGKNPFQLDSKPATLKLKDYIYNETRYTMLAKANPEEAKRLLGLAQEDVNSRWRLYEHWAAMPTNGANPVTTAVKEEK